jgi:tRNA A37 methylthiotransferase MiaB
MFICGFPTETPAEFADTLRFLDRNQENISAIQRSVFSLEQGSPVSKGLPKFSIEDVWLRQPVPGRIALLPWL